VTALFIELFQDGSTYAQENGLLFMETSAKTSSNVNEILLEIGNGYY